MKKGLITTVGRREFMGSVVGAWSLLKQPLGSRLERLARRPMLTHLAMRANTFSWMASRSRSFPAISTACGSPVSTGAIACARSGRWA